MTDEPGAVSLEEIYVPLRAVYATPLDKDAKEDRTTGAIIAAIIAARPDWQHLKHTFVWFEDHIEIWLKQQSRRDAFRILSGEPGSGKSAFGMMAAARWAREGRQVLRVPLHLIDFAQGAFAAIGGYAKRPEVLGFDPLEGLQENECLILILDGLDELSKVNEQAGALARGFVDSLILKVNIENAFERARVLVLLAGRPIVTQQSTETFREPGQRVDILRLTVKRRDYPNLTATADLRKDQRDDWWRNYGRATGHELAGLPQDYQGKSSQIDDITAQPLLNYLLALVRDARLQAGEEPAVKSVHALYGEIFELLYRRRKGRLAPETQAEDRFDLSYYKRFLEEVAIAAWQAGDRSVAKADIEARFKACDAATLGLITQHFGSIESGVYAILSSFFVSPDGGSPGVYSFTHKSFREYLTAARLVREVKTIHEDLQNARRYTVEAALTDWYNLSSRTEFDFDLLSFMREEIDSHINSDRIGEWRETLKKLFEVNLRDGMPGYKDAPTFRDAEWRACNAEAALFAMLNACARSSLKAEALLDLDWGSSRGLRDLLHRQAATGSKDYLILTMLNSISLASADLTFADPLRDVEPLPARTLKNLRRT